MALNRENFRAIIFYNFRHGLTQQQCIEEFNSILGDEAPSITSVYLGCAVTTKNDVSLEGSNEGSLLPTAAIMVSVGN